MIRNYEKIHLVAIQSIEDRPSKFLMTKKTNFLNLGCNGLNMNVQLGSTKDGQKMLAIYISEMIQQ